MTKDSKESLKEAVLKSWFVFGRIALNAPVLITLVAAFVLMVASYVADNDTVKMFFSILAMFASAISASIGYANWQSYFETGKLVEKGKSAVKGLKLTQNELSRFENRVKTFLAANTEAQDSSLVTTNLEEIIAKIVSLQEQTIASIENWTDVLPGVDVKSKIGEYSNKTDELRKVEEEREKIKAEFDAIKQDQEADQERRKELAEALRAKNDHLDKVVEELRKAKTSLDSGLLSGLDLSGSGSSKSTTASLDFVPKIDAPLLGMKKCESCGRAYTPSGAFDVGVCPRCDTV